jgi:hypothetical protein
MVYIRLSRPLKTREKNKKKTYIAQQHVYRSLFLIIKLTTAKTIYYTIIKALKNVHCGITDELFPRFLIISLISTYNTAGTTDIDI